MTLETLVAALFLFWLLRALIVALITDAPTQRVAIIVLLILAIIWVLVYGQIPPLVLSIGG